MNKFSIAMNNTFGFLVSQPIHKTLRQLRIYTVLLLLASVDIMYRLVGILESSEALSGGQTTGAVATLAAAVFAVIWKGISNLAEVHKDDD